MADKIYVGKGKVINGKYGDFTSLYLTEKDVETLRQNLKNGAVKVNINKRKEVDDYGNSHYGVIDNWEKK